MNIYDFTTYELKRIKSMSINDICNKYGITEDNARFIRAASQSIG